VNVLTLLVISSVNLCTPALGLQLVTCAPSKSLLPPNSLPLPTISYAPVAVPKAHKESGPQTLSMACYHSQSELRQTTDVVGCVPVAGLMVHGPV
jgi:hypothetical protein